jgi:HK97 family phage major capsid protein
MSFATDTAGGFLVPNEVATAMLIPLLYAKSVVMDLGATSLPNLTKAPFQIPRVSGGTTGYWLGEAATITPSDMAAQMLSLNPHGLAALTVISDLLQTLDNPGVEAMVNQDQARQLALQLDLKALKGTGASGTPIGVINATGVNTSGVSATPTYDELLDAVGAVQEDNALEGNLGWAIAYADLQLIRKMKDAVGADNKASVQPLGDRSLLSGTAPNEMLLGYKVRMSTQLATGDIVFGNWADLIVAQWGGLRLDMTNALGFATGQTHIRALTYADVGVRHAVSFNVG